MGPSWELPLGALLDAAPDGIMVCDPTGTLALVNAAAEAMFGYGHGELLGQRIETLIPMRSRELHAQHLAGYAAAPRTRAMATDLDLRALRKNGSEFPVEISLSPLATRSGMLIIAIVRDVTERRQLERGHSRAMAFLVSAVEAVQDAFILYDERDRVLMANQAAVQLFEGAVSAVTGDATSSTQALGSRVRSQSPLVGMAFRDLIGAALSAGVFDLLSETPASLASRWHAYHCAPNGAFEIRTTNGRYLRITDRITAEHGVVSIIADVTADMRHAAELDSSRQAAEAANSAKSEFLSSMSHELRTPLNAVLGFAQLLESDRKHPLDARQQERLGYVLRGGEHLLHLVDDVLDLSRIESGRIAIAPESVEVATVVREIIDTLEPMATRAGIAIVVSTSLSRELRVVADRTRLAQILMNFGSNAIKYGKANGRVDVRVENRQDAVRIVVADDGVGIPEDKCAKIFEPFERAGQETGSIEGTGIGLAISKRLAELMHGSVGFTTQAGRGSEFWVDVPPDRESTRDAAAGTGSPNSRAHAAKPGHSTIVYIEDNPPNIALMREVVQALTNVELVVAPTENLGLDLVQHHLPHLVIIGVHMPGLSGCEAAKRLRAASDTRSIPLVALSTSALPADGARHFDHCFVKPVNIAELIGVLDAMLRRAH